VNRVDVIAEAFVIDLDTAKALGAAASSHDNKSIRLVLDFEHRAPRHESKNQTAENSNYQ
jgi:hypothetical protein